MTRTVNGHEIITAEFDANGVQYDTVLIAEKDADKARKACRKSVGENAAIVGVKPVRKRFYMDDAFFFANAVEIPLDEEENDEE